MNEDKSLDSIIERIQHDKVPSLLRKAKLFTLLRTIVLSIAVCIVLFLIFLSVNRFMLNIVSLRSIEEERNYSYITGPNSFSTDYTFTQSFLTGELSYLNYKIIGNKPVYNGTTNKEYDLIPFFYSKAGEDKQPIQIRDDININECTVYSIAAQRQGYFYHPSIKYEKYKNDLDLLQDIGKDKYIELSLSLDKGYSFQEISDMIPAGIKISWYWIDTYSIKEVEYMKKCVPQNVLYHADIFGIDGIDKFGNVLGKQYKIDNETYSEPELFFIDTLKEGIVTKSPYQRIYQRIYSNIKGNKRDISKEDLHVIGLVVTGNSGNLGQLRNVTAIKGVTLGTVIDKY